jgi:PAS domain S-box-containing protein
MGAGTRAQNQQAGAAPRVKPPKLLYIYFLLAAFDLVTVSAGLYLNHRIMGIYVRSVEANRVWAERTSAYSRLGELAGAVNAPGNDVFNTREVETELARMTEAVEAFDVHLLEQRREMKASLDPEVAVPLLALLDAIAAAKAQMTDEAERIFHHFLEGQPGLAGERMATMDRKYASVNAALVELERAVGRIQHENFTRQTAAAAELQRYQYGTALSIIVMVFGATYYGHKIAQQMEADAGEREHHLNALQEAEARTRSILDTAADGIVSFDGQGQIASFNKAAERLFGHDAGNAVGLDIRAMIPAVAECLDPSGAVAASAQPAGGTRIIAGTGRRADGTEFPLELSVSTVSIGRVRTFTAIVRDIGDRRRAEEAIAAAAAAQAANRAKSQFLANMSHEIRTPMSGVLGMAEMLLETALTPAQRRFAESVHRSGESLLKIIDGILDFSKIEAGKIDLEHVDFEPRALVEEVTQLLRDPAQRKGLALVCHVTDDVPPALRGAPSRLRQVLINLVGNAVKFTDKGRVVITVSTLAVDRDGRAAGAAHDATGSVLHVSVEDTGIGIAPVVQARLFHAFEQADSSTTRSYGGTGLGLAISRELVERMGGRIGVRSAPGQGSEFWFTVRLDAPQRRLSSTDGPTSTPHPVSLHGVRVLLAEDNPLNQDVAMTMLQSFGCQVRVVDNGVKALDALATSAFDIVLMDRQMPEMDGFDTTAEIRRRGLLRPRQPQDSTGPLRLPIVGLTASALKGDRDMCIGAGMDDYLAKPFRRDALRSALERWVLDQPAGRAANDVRAEEALPVTFDRRMLDAMCLSVRSGGARVLAGLIDRYCIDATRSLAALEAAAGAPDAAALAHAAHVLGQESAFVGALMLARLCRELEHTVLAGHMHGIDRHIAGIRREYEAVHLALDAMRSQAPGVA